MSENENFQPISTIPSHVSPPADGIVYFTFDRQHYKAQVGTYVGADLRPLMTRHTEKRPDIIEWELWRVVPGGPDLKIEPEDTVELDRSGFRFFTCPRYINDG